MSEHEPVEFSRDVEVVLVPSGAKMVMHQGTSGIITQALGGTWTVVTDNGFMVRVQPRDADAIGKIAEVEEAKPETTLTVESAQDLEKLIWDELRTCYDPEIPVNIADLGLVYRCEVVPLDEGGHRVEIDMTLTAPGCGMGDVLKAEVEGKVEALPTVKGVAVEVVLEPPWDFSMIPDATKLTLGMY